MTDSDALAEFAISATLESAPPTVVQKLKTTLLHSLGMLRAGSGIAPAGLALAGAYDGPGSASLLHNGQKAHRDRAVLANAAMLHARTQDDTHLPAITHLAATCLPALIAVAEGEASSGRDLLTGMLVSYEVGSAVAVDTGPACSSRGFRPSSVLGGVAASAGAARLMKLGQSAVASAIGLAASFGGGTNQTWVAGTDEWQYQVGVAGRNGILAAELAAAGATGAAESLEGKAGLYRAFTGMPAPHTGPTDLGVHWRTLEVTYKPFPVCAINQMPVTVLLAMMDQLRFTAADIDSAQLRLSPPEAAYPGTDSYGPFAGPTAALMSAPFCLAVAAQERTVTRAMIQAFDDKGTLALSDRIKVVSDGTLKPGECVIVVEGRRGKFGSDQIETPAPFNWEFDEVYRRLVDLGPELGMRRLAFDGLADCLRDLENRSVGDLIAAVTA
jgi:2-methylcitrate dehydratase PrpD